MAGLSGIFVIASADDIAIVNAALALEFQTIAAYQLGAESSLRQKPLKAPYDGPNPYLNDSP